MAAVIDITAFVNANMRPHAEKLRLANLRAQLLQDAVRYRAERDHWQTAMDDALDSAQRIKEQMGAL